MLQLVAKIVCSVVLAMIVKNSEQQKLNMLSIIRVNYAVAAVIAFLLLLAEPYHRPDRHTLLVSVLGGASYAFALMLWSLAIGQSGIALTVGITRVSIVVPIVLSTVIWHELPRLHQAIGIVLGIAGIVIAGWQPTHRGAESQHQSRSWLAHSVPAALFVASGIAALSSKLFDELCPAQDNLQFQTLLFVTAFGVTSIFHFARREQVGKSALSWGALLGAVNLGTSVFMVMALAVLPGTIAFAVAAATEVALIAALGRFVWKESMNRLSLFGVGMTVLALILMNV